MPLFSFFRKKLKNQSIKNFLTLLSGSVISQVIIFVSILIITRLFEKEVFGAYILFSSTILILKVLASLNYELAILLPKEDKDAANLLIFNLFIICCICIVFYLITYIFHQQIVSFLEVELLGAFVYLLPASVFLISTVNALDYWNNRNNKFKNISIGIVSKSLATGSSQIITGFSTFKSIGLIPGLILGQLIHLLLMIKMSFSSIQNLSHHITFKAMLKNAARYKDIPLFNTLIGFINTFSNELPILLLTQFFGLSSAGLYGLAIRVSKTPSGLIGQSVGQVFFNRASKTINEKGNLRRLIVKTYKNLFFSALLIFSILFGISFFLDYLFGDEWKEVGLYVRVLLPWLFVMYLNSPITSLITILNKQKLFIFYDSLLLLFRFLSFYIGYTIYNDVIISLLLFSGIGVLFNLFFSAYFLVFSKKHRNHQMNFYN